MNRINEPVFRERLRFCMSQQGYTSATLADKLGVTVATVQRWKSEIKHTVPHEWAIEGLAQVFDVTLVWLKGLDTQEEKRKHREKGMCCRFCGSDKYMNNKAGEKNNFCGQCGNWLHWEDEKKC